MENDYRDFPKEIKNNSELNNPLADIIANIQETLDNTKSTKNVNETKNTYNQNTHSTYQNDKNTNDSFDFSNLLKVLGNFGITSNSSSPQNLNEDSGLNLNTIMKFSKLLNGLNQDDPRKNLLNSLKPFMRDTRKKNVDTYIFALGILNVLDNLGKEDSGNNDT